MLEILVVIMFIGLVYLVHLFSEILKSGLKYNKLVSTLLPGDLVEFDLGGGEVYNGVVERRVCGDVWLINSPREVGEPVPSYIDASQIKKVIRISEEVCQ